jgi:hypothetical protein
MPIFIAVHKWKPEEQLTVLKEIYRFFTKFTTQASTEVECHSTYMSENRAFCVWKAPSIETLEKAFSAHAPTIKKGTEFIPVVQMVPPTMEYTLSLIKNILDVASEEAKE